jgi:predicted small metal-binding protein
MRGLDCVHDAHEDIHFSASDDEGLVEQVKQHRDEYHSEMSDDDVRNIVSQNAYDE